MFAYVGNIIYDIHMSNETEIVKVKVGKPRLRPDTPLTKTIAGAVAPDELAQIKSTAEHYGLTVSQYLRAATVGTATLDPQTREKVFTAAGSAIPNPDQTRLDLMPD